MWRYPYQTKTFLVIYKNINTFIFLKQKASLKNPLLKNYDLEFLKNENLLLF